LTIILEDLREKSIAFSCFLYWSQQNTGDKAGHWTRQVLHFNPGFIWILNCIEKENKTISFLVARIFNIMG